MTLMRHSARISALPAALAAALIALAALCGAVALAPAAHAHDQLISTDPADGDTLAEAPAELRLTFSGEIQDIGSAVELTDAAGEAYGVDTAVERTDLIVTPAEPLPAGDYSLAWRVTSSDGHPIEGTVGNDGAVEFTVEGGNDDAAAATSAPAGDEPTSAPASSAPATTGPVSPEATESESSGPIELDLTEEENSWAAPLIIILLAAAALAAVIVVIAKVRDQQK